MMQEIIERGISEATTLDELSTNLEHLLNGNFSVWHDGTLLRTRARVDSINGVLIYINPKEHAPPHFHVKAGLTNATLRISDGSLLNGSLAPNHEKLISWWFQRAKPRLVLIWNVTRPSNCPVGKID